VTSGLRNIITRIRNLIPVIGESDARHLGPARF
jgi:hypothetical protein